jgi:uncharacterized protein YdcH (DUF465 family)
MRVPDFAPASGAYVLGMTQHHDLTKEFPEFSDRIHTMKQTNGHFRRLLEEYAQLDNEVVRMDDNLEPTSDTVMERAKLRRIALKDELYGLLREG